MDKALVFGVMLLLLVNTSASMFDALTTETWTGETWTGETIYIRADGNIDPSDAPIVHDDTFTLYVLTKDLVISSGDGIVIELDNIIIDGAGHTIQGSGGRGFVLSKRYNVTVKNTKIVSFFTGVFISCSSKCTISGNSILEGYEGIYLSDSCDNIISENSIASVTIGISLGPYCDRNIICRNTITECGHGVDLMSAYGNIISGNNILHNYRGIFLETGMNIVIGNNIVSNDVGIKLYHSQGVIITRNMIAKNGDGIILIDSTGNKICHNNFINNTKQAVSDALSIKNTWDNGYWPQPIYAYMGTEMNVEISTWDSGCPSGGNYWSDYIGTDNYSGLYQNITGSDGIGDIPYIINEKNIDNFPLMKPRTEPDFSFVVSHPTIQLHLTESPNLPVSIEKTITVISLFDFSQSIQLNVSGLPSGVTVSFDPKVVTPPPNGVSMFTVSFSIVDKGVKPGKYNITVVGTSGDVTHTVSLFLTIIIIRSTNIPLSIIGIITICGIIFVAGIHTLYSRLRGRRK